MEEILASIRRIIEDSDQVRPPVDEAPVEGMAVSEPVLSQDVDAFRAELEEPAPVTGPSMADIQASMAAAVSRSAPEIAEIHAFRAEQRAEPPAIEPEPAPVETVEIEPVVADEVTAYGEPADETEPVDFAPATIAEPARQELAEMRHSLISDNAGRQVAAAFGELSEAFAASRRRSFDDMAEEMLRPMLQDWLDNNLPTLVEKLVREEIERVARGGQR